MRTLARIIRETRVLWPLYLGVVIASLLTTALGLAGPFIIKAATDAVVAQVQGNGRPDLVQTVLWFAVALFVTELLSGVIQNVGGYFGDVMAARVRQILSTRYFEKLLALPQRYFDDQVTGTIISRLNRSISELAQFLQAFANNLFPMLLTVAAVLVISAFYWWPLAVLLALIFPAYLWLTTLTSKKWQELEGRKNEEIDLASGRFAEVVGQIKVVKSFVQEGRELGVFARRFGETIGLTREQSRYWHTMDALRRGVLSLVFFAIYAILFVRTANGDFTVGDLVLLLQLVAQAKFPVTMMSYLVDATQRAIAGSKSYLEVMDEPVDPQPASGSVQVREGNETPVIEFDHVSFGYDDGPDVLRDISFTVRHGEQVALVSESGGGKTTLIGLLLGFYRPRTGSLRVGGVDVSQIPGDELRRQVGVVFQEASLFSGTIRENITYAKPDASDAEVELAARRAHADVFIQGFADGYESTIGERGLKLSGGQKQRIAVARAMVKDAPILVLDEATSALDSKAERLVQAGLDELMQDRTSLIIAHRLSTIAAVDTIVTLSGGGISEIGSPAALANTGGIYSELLALQASTSKRDRRRLKEYGFTA